MARKDDHTHRPADLPREELLHPRRPAAGVQNGCWIIMDDDGVERGQVYLRVLLYLRT